MCQNYGTAAGKKNNCYEYSYGPINDWEYKLLSFSLGTALFWAISVVLICAQILQMLQKFQEYGTNGPKNT